MGGYGCTVRLQHTYAQSFFADVIHPDLDELQRRDDFLAELEDTYPIRTEGTDLVVEIPDLDIATLIAVPENKDYIVVSSHVYHYNSSRLKTGTPRRDLVYTNSSVRNIAA